MAAVVGGYSVLFPWLRKILAVFWKANALNDLVRSRVWGNQVFAFREITRILERLEAWYSDNYKKHWHENDIIGLTARSVAAG